VKSLRKDVKHCYKEKGFVTMVCNFDK